VFTGSVVSETEWCKWNELKDNSSFHPNFKSAFGLLFVVVIVVFFLLFWASFA